VNLLGFDPVEAFNLVLGRLDRLAVALERIGKQLERIARTLDDQGK
jgi:hypothetical protein